MRISIRHISIMLSVISLLIMTESCKSKNYFVKNKIGKTIDTRLVGVWTGFEKDNQIKGMTKEWKMTRTDDGKFILDFKATYGENVQQFVEEGEWWIENDIFHEYHNVSMKTDKYKYTILNKIQIKFKSVTIGVEHENQEYEFIDTRMKN